MGNPLDTVSRSLSQYLLDAIQSAIEDLKVEESQFPTNTQNGRSGRFWDFLNTNIGKIPSSELSNYKLKFGSWGLLYILEQKSGIVFTLMRKQRFESLSTSKNDDIPRYIQASLLKNANQVSSLVQPELDLFIFSETKKEGENELFSQIFSDLTFHFPEQSITQYGIIIFGINDERVSYLKAIIPDMNLEPLFMKDMLAETKVQMPAIVPTFEEVKTVGLKLKDKAKKHKKAKEQSVGVRFIGEKADKQTPL
ncbi:hypothetical protein SpiGrapes_0577 [Sphaerochaeta pleomorpha str. Grapes]|uniref:Uncharacterized protein n=1 Tax=Sphaerochaeta pleomorpha (strain ATCC BAA-1885 / DSM 22778 / Grapes) TaxID=158190 RepID=G8QXC6_SPHPG|nr:DUF5986 family protein [Sphaerochaeta pleomorpha]AEV28427.1 hypothetical protein SpiGrapes_0577 [Sphaerochaeta pleomorpha str. Grapes]